MHAFQNKTYALMNFLFLYVNVLVTFAVIYLFLDITGLGPLISILPSDGQPVLLMEKWRNSLQFSLKALFFDDFSGDIAVGWAKGVALVEGTVGFLLPAFIMLKFMSVDHVRLERQKRPIIRKVLRAFFVTAGALFVAVGLELFLVPNKIIDGGIVGISIMMSYLTGLKLELFLLVLNIPFLYLGYRQIGRNFVLATLLGITILSLGTLTLYNVAVATDNSLSASLFGGVFLGVGAGLVIRHGGSLDGTEILGILLNRRTPFSVGNVILFLNIFIFASSGFVFGWDRVVYSLFAYYIASKMIDITLKRYH
ncbi:YitT family protein [Pseudoneobacillus sp. C159]